MKNITVWIITGALLAGAAVAYVSKEFSESNDPDYVEVINDTQGTEEETENNDNQVIEEDIENVESADAYEEVAYEEVETAKGKEDIRPEDIKPKAIGKSVVERDGMVFVDLEGYGTSESTDELKAFQKYGYLEFNGKMRIVFDPRFFDGTILGNSDDYDWKLQFLAHGNKNQKAGYVEFFWGNIELINPSTQAFIYFGTRPKDFSKYFDECWKKYRNTDPELDKIAKMMLTPIDEDTDKLGISAYFYLIRKSDGKIGMYNEDI